MQIRLSKDVITLLSSYGIVDGRGVNQFLKKKLSDTVDVSIPKHSSDRDESSALFQSLLEKIYSDTQKIVGAIEKKKEVKEVDSLISDKQKVMVIQRYNHYANIFKESGGRGTDDKNIESTYVYEEGDNIFNKELWKKLGMLVMSSGVDWTIYMNEALLSNEL